MPVADPVGDLSLLAAPLAALVRRLRVQAAIHAIAAGAAAAGIGALLGLTPAGIALMAAGALLSALLLQEFMLRRRALDKHHLAEHLNRRFPELEESAQLLLTTSPGLAALQRARVAKVLPGCLDARARWLPGLKTGPAMATILAGALLLMLGPELRQRLADGAAQDTGTDPAQRTSSVSLTEVEVTVIPPDYTGMATERRDGLDVEVPEGGTVRWRLRADAPGEYALRLGDDPPVPLVRAADGLLSASTRVERSTLYRILRRHDEEYRPLEGVHTLSVLLDRPPRLRILEPASTALELSPGGPVRFTSRYAISDDHGLGPVELRASVASGSGEGVKFRERRFELSREGEEDAHTIYGRDWDLSELGMAPGEEVYFFVTAADNRQPEPNRSRSDTVVVRWLDEEPEPVTADGLGFDWMPEYFKSQRQIVIETEQLLSDRPFLGEEAFVRDARALGRDQGDLKLRYGQYLGDEFEGWDESAVAQSDFGIEGEGSQDEHAEEHHADDGHGHGEPGAGTASAPGDARAVIARFMHDHGAAEIGPITERNPVGLMKRALANMWQAELHLLLAEPDQALPFEREALKYLQMARQAERIFTRRLGFEPPPVSEERRLSGELDEARSWSRSGEGALRDDDGTLFRALFEYLSHGPLMEQDAPQREILERARDRLVQRAQQRPALLRHAANLERFLDEAERAAENCPDCLRQLRELAWSMVPHAEAMPGAGARALAPGDELARDAAGLHDQGAGDAPP